jgi:hypothetical protein
MHSLETALTTLVRARWALIGVGVVLIVGGISAALYEAARDRDHPILLYPTAIALSEQGEIFIYSEWRTIRVFSAEGVQIDSWPVDTRRGAAVVRVEAGGNLSVATLKNRRLHVFSPEGRTVSSKIDRDAYERFDHRNRRRAKGADGSSYEIVDMAVIRTDPSGASEVVIAGVPAPLRPFFFPRIPPMVFAVAGAAAFSLGVGLSADKQDRERNRDRLGW